jgi:hypothetical protein
VGNLAFFFFDGEQGLSNCQAQWGALCLCVSQEAGLLVLLTEQSVKAFLSVENLVFLLFNGEVVAVLCEKCWAFMCLREAGVLAPIEWQITIQELASHSLTGKWGLSLGRVWWLSLGLRALSGGKPPGTSRVAKNGAWGSLGLWWWAPGTE